MQADPLAQSREGGRSRTGRVEPSKVTPGIGHILKDLDRPRVVCAYLRGARQTTWSALPARGDTLHLYVEVLEPKTEATGLRASRDLAGQVIEKIKAMEDAHFARVHQRSAVLDAHAGERP